MHIFTHSKTLLNFIKAQFLLKKIVREFAPNLIESHSFLPGLYLGCFKMLRHSFKSTQFSTANFRHHNLNHHLKRNKRAILLDKFIYTFHDMSVVPSSSTFSVLLAEGCNINKILLIPHQLNSKAIQFAIESGLPKYSIASNRYELIAVGRLDWQKNYDLMMSVLSLLKTKRTQDLNKVISIVKWTHLKQVIINQQRKNYHSSYESKNLQRNNN